MTDPGRWWLADATIWRRFTEDAMTDELTDYAITEAMLRYGGGFVADLGALFRRADAENQAILKAAFAHYWAEYAEIARLGREP